ncbi:putative coenzyme Q-binding protein [Babesia sp. Xinjiang]|uniref:putative coenzyme Q-binding protein n=1 Tax=Babesia sp. Xinjiang TaxID=462227 RepID=UPI000A215548|nr:putative coenzyme Q-binding protein [Babesia sp. Xinjiang]ORM40775.1 putative coenzyme Q-binding protein [Babesia sp. Xinjiang]
MLKCLNLFTLTGPLHYKKTKLLSIPRGIVYNTVLDIPSYSQFLPWCKSYWIDYANDCELAARPGQRKACLTVDFKLLKESYTSQVQFEPLDYIRAVAADSALFETLDTVWEFKDQGDATIVNFYIVFKFNLGVYQRISASMSDTLTNTMVEQFVKECYRRHNNQK